MRAQRRETPVRAGAGTVPALERQPRRPPHLGTAPARRVKPLTGNTATGVATAHRHADCRHARSQDFRVLTINQPIATTARVEAVKLTHLLARASPGRKSYSAVRSRQAAANRMILWPVPSTRAQPTRAEPLSVQSIKQP